MLKKPKQTKFSKYQKGKISYNFKFISLKRKTLSNENSEKKTFFLISEEPARLTAAQIAAAELAIKRKVRKEGAVNTHVFPHFPVTKKPLEVRMGKGKGNIAF